MQKISLRTQKREELVDITIQVEEALRQERAGEGNCVVFCPHTTAALTINENADPAVSKDILCHLRAMVPPGKDYAHLEGNADAHIKSVLVGSSLFLIVQQGKPVLGTWQGIYFCEFDGPRQRHVYVRVQKA